jgi:hypothetical protein
MSSATNEHITEREAPRDPMQDQLLHPSRFYARPADVVADDLLTIEERRSILSAWASDACAVESNPPMRRAPFAAAMVTFDEIMEALSRLDRLKPSMTGTSPARRRAYSIDLSASEYRATH